MTNPSLSLYLGFDWPLEFNSDFVQLEFGGNQASTIGDVNATVLSTTGCSKSDFDGFEAGNVAILKLALPYNLSSIENLNNCSAYQRALNAQAAQASGVIFVSTLEKPAGEHLPALSPISRLMAAAVLNPMIGGLNLSWQFPTLASDPVNAGTTVPVFLVSETFSSFFYGSSTPAELRVTAKVDSKVENVIAENAICKLASPTANYTVLIGAQWDIPSISVTPRFNDLTAAAVVAELAQTIYRTKSVYWLGGDLFANDAICALWGGNQFAQLGVVHFIQQNQALLPKLAGYIDVSTPASSNGPLLVNYHGVGNNGSLPRGTESQAIQSSKMSSYSTYSYTYGDRTFGVPFNPQSAHAAFFLSSAPATGLSAGTYGLRTQSTYYTGGLVNQAYDPCFNQMCDSISSLSSTTLSTLTGSLCKTVASVLADRFVFGAYEVYKPYRHW